MVVRSEDVGTSFPDKDLPESAGEIVALTPKENFEGRPHLKKVKPWGYTYFVRRGDAIKIGQSTIPKHRIGALQTSFPDRLEVLAVIPNTIIDEPTTHQKFAHLRIGGEWFRAEPELIEFIAEVKSRPIKPLARKIDPAVTMLLKFRRKRGADTPAGHCCSNISEQRLALHSYVRPSWATHPTQTLAARMAWQADRLATLTAAQNQTKGRVGRQEDGQ